MKKTLSYVIVSSATMLLVVSTMSCNRSAEVKVIKVAREKESGPVFEAEIEIAPGRKAVFKLPGKNLARVDIEGDYKPGGTEVISNVGGDARDTIEVQIGRGIKPGKATLTAEEWEPGDAGQELRIVALFRINVKGKGMPVASMTSQDRLYLDDDVHGGLQKDIVLEQGAEATVDVTRGIVGSATDGTDGVSVAIEPPPAGRFKHGSIKLTANYDAKIGDQLIILKAADGRFRVGPDGDASSGTVADDEAENGITYSGEAKLNVTIKAREHLTSKPSAE